MGVGNSIHCSEHDSIYTLTHIYSITKWLHSLAGVFWVRHLFLFPESFNGNSCLVWKLVFSTDIRQCCWFLSEFFYKAQVLSSSWFDIIFLIVFVYSCFVINLDISIRDSMWPSLWGEHGRLVLVRMLSYPLHWDCVKNRS
jgi:hypothetical protein